MYMYVHTYEGQRSTLDAIPQELFTFFFFEIVFHRLTETILAGQGILGILLSLPSSSGTNAQTPHLVFKKWVLG